jgi:hypothetical protein
VNENLQILIQNRTDSLIHITLFPKAEYLSGNLYLHSEGGSGYNSTEFSLLPNNEGYYNWSEVLFVSGDLNIEPQILAAKVFDSIYVNSKNEDSVIMKFTHEAVTGYSENIFTKNSTWDFSIEEADISTSTKKMVIQHCYKFVILENKIIIK